MSIEQKTFETDDEKMQLAQEAFRDFYAQCFWYLRKDLKLAASDIPEIVHGLRQHGGKDGFLVAARLS